VVTPPVASDVEHIYHLYVIRCEGRDELQKALGEVGVASGLHYPLPIHLQPAYAELGYERGDFPVTEAYADTIVSLPMFPELTDEQIAYVVDAMTAFFAREGAALAAAAMAD
jgi:dTDP-4-amino-4,6-dideoxygalactose transaminase